MEFYLNDYLLATVLIEEPNSTDSEAAADVRADGHPLGLSRGYDV